MKKKLDSKQLGRYGLLFYNSLFILPFALAMAYLGGDMAKVWTLEPRLIIYYFYYTSLHILNSNNLHLCFILLKIDLR